MSVKKKKAPVKKIRSIIRWKNKTQRKEHLIALSNNPQKEAIPYLKEENYELGDYLAHPKFGLGFIHNVINTTKIEVFFQDSEKILLQNWS